MFYNKRGQFYIIISVVLAIAVFGITSRPNTIEEAILFEDFDDLTNNYISESEYVINNALKNEEDVQIELNGFTLNYLEYAKQNNPNLQLLYVYSNGTDTILVNHFNSTIKLQNSTTLGAGEPLIQDILISVGGKEFNYKVPVKAEKFGYNWYSSGFPSEFNLSVAGFLHDFDLSGNGPEFKVLINLPQGQQEVIYPGSTDYDFVGSPPLGDESLLRQVKLRK